MDHKKIVEDMMSRDTQRIRVASSDIIKAGQDRELLKPLIPSIEKMKLATKGLDMGGMFAPNSRFPEYAIKTLEFHRDSDECTCRLYASGYDSFDPDNEAKAKHIDIVSTSDDNYYLVVRCKKCGDEYDIEVINSHWVFYKWSRRGK